MKYEAVIFDLDGTILNTLPDLTASVNYALDKFGYAERTIDEIRNFIGNGVGLLIKRSLPSDADDLINNECLKTFKAHYQQNYAVKTVPYNDIEYVLRTLKDNGIKVGIVSNKFNSAVNSLSEKFFNGLYDIAVGEREGIPRKPAPDSVLEVISALKVDKSKVLYVGDSEVDIQTAKNAQIDCVSVAWGFKDKKFLEDNGASNIISAPIEILDCIK